MIRVIPKILLHRAEYLVLQRDTDGLYQTPLYGSKNRINQLKTNVSVNKLFIHRNYTICEVSLAEDCPHLTV